MCWIPEATARGIIYVIARKSYKKEKQVTYLLVLVRDFCIRYRLSNLFHVASYLHPTNYVSNEGIMRHKAILIVSNLIHPRRLLNRKEYSFSDFFSNDWPHLTCYLQPSLSHSDAVYCLQMNRPLNHLCRCSLHSWNLHPHASNWS
jgi:hypothetical protein